MTPQVCDVHPLMHWRFLQIHTFGLHAKPYVDKMLQMHTLEWFLSVLFANMC